MTSIYTKIRNTQTYSIGYDKLLANSEDLMKDVDALLDKARKWVDGSEYEGRSYTYSRGGPGGWLDYKNATDKAWIALCQAIDVLLDKNNITSQHGGRHDNDRKMPAAPIKGNYDRKLALKKLEETNSELASKNYYNRYVARTTGLRNNSNYYTKVDLQLVDWEVAKVKEIINEIKSL